MGSLALQEITRKTGGMYVQADLANSMAMLEIAAVANGGNAVAKGCYILRAH